MDILSIMMFSVSVLGGVIAVGLSIQQLWRMIVARRKIEEMIEQNVALKNMLANMVADNTLDDREVLDLVFSLNRALDELSSSKESMANESFKIRNKITPEMRADILSIMDSASAQSSNHRLFFEIAEKIRT